MADGKSARGLAGCSCLFSCSSLFCSLNKTNQTNQRSQMNQIPAMRRDMVSVFSPWRSSVNMHA